MAGRIITVCLLGTSWLTLAGGNAPLAADGKKPEMNSEVVTYFHTGAADTKDTRLPKGTRIRLHVEAGNYVYDYDGTTIEGETVEDVAFQIHSSMKDNGWNATLLKSGLGVAVYGCAQGTQPYKAVTKAGINYSGTTQPIQPSTQGNLQLLILDKDKWKPKPKLQDQIPCDFSIRRKVLPC